MARSGKTTGESPSKSQAEKGAHAAAKTSRELEEEFVLEVPSMTRPVPVAVDASPAQIPRKSEAVTVSSIALPSPMAKNSQETTYAAPGTVTIPSQSFAPPPPHNSTRDTLSVPTIRSCMNYNAIPIEYAYLIDVEDCSSEDKLRSHGELFAENRQHRRRLGRN